MAGLLPNEGFDVGAPQLLTSGDWIGKDELLIDWGYVPGIDCNPGDIIVDGIGRIPFEDIIVGIGCVRNEGDTVFKGPDCNGLVGLA